MAKRKKKITETNVQIEVFKSLSSITEMMTSFKEIISSMFEMEMKQGNDLGIMNERWNQIKEKVDSMSGDVDEVKTKMNQLIVQWDWKEKEKILTNKKMSMPIWLKKIVKNPYIIIPTILIIVGLILILTGVISWEEFIRGFGFTTIPNGG